MYLAQHLGYASPTGMLREMTSTDLLLWQAYYEHRPFGEVREDLRHAIRCILFATANSKKGTKFEVKDFLPKVGSSERPAEKMTSDQMLRQVVAINELLGGQDLRVTKVVNGDQ